MPVSQRPTTRTSLIVRVRPDPTGAVIGDTVASLRRVLHDLDPAIPILTSGEWRSLLAMSFFPAQVATVALGLFGAFGLLLSITGTFGLASYTVSKRIRELSIRVALGAQARQVLSAALGRMSIASLDTMTDMCMMPIVALDWRAPAGAYLPCDCDT